LGRPFWRIWTAIAVSSVGDGMVLVALPLLALSETHNALAIAGVMVVGEAPLAFASLPIGAIADRVNRRRMIVLIQLLRFAALAAFGLLVLTGVGGLAAIYVTSMVFGTLDVAFDVVLGASIPSIVDEEKLGPANAHLYNAESVGQEIVGRAAGGVLVAWIRSLPFLFDAATFVASAALLNRAVPDETPEPTGSTTWADLKEGLAWYFRNPALRLLTSVIASLAFCQAMVLSTLALYVKVDLHLSQAAYGYLLAVASIGNIIGGLVAARLGPAARRGGTIAVVAFLTAGVYPVMALTHSALVAATALAVESITVLIGNVTAATIRQSIVPKRMQGRGTSAYRAVLLACFSLGGVAGGAIAALSSVPTAFITAGGLQIAVILLVGPRLVRRVRKGMSEPPVVLELTDAALAQQSGSEQPSPGLLGSVDETSQQPL
jgi:MFS family permease